MTANLQGTVVAVKKMDVQRVEINRKILVELKQVRQRSREGVELGRGWGWGGQGLRVERVDLRRGTFGEA